MYSSCAFFYDFTWFFILAKLNSFLSLDLSSITWFFINSRYITSEFLKLTASEPKALPFTALEVMDFLDYSLKLSERGAIKVIWLLLCISYDKAFIRIMVLRRWPLVLGNTELRFLRFGREQCCSLWVGSSEGRK